jgi:hypothetical protein
MQVYNPEEARDKILDGTAPADMIVDGDLDLSNSTTLTELPKGLIVEGWLILRGCRALTQLSDGLSVLVDLNLGWCTALTHLPKGLNVGHSLHLDGCTSLKALPAHLNVGGGLSLRDCTALTELPDGLSVYSNLDLDGCTALTHLPNGFQVHGKLFLRDCISLTALPNDLKVGGSINLTNCTSLTHLPKDFAVGGTLELTNCTSLTALPYGLYVGGWIVLTHPLEIPDTVKCKGFTFRGVEDFPREYINNPQLIKSADILNEQNAQKRSVLLELMGIQRFMREANPVIVYQDVEHNGNVRQLLQVELPTVIDEWTDLPIQEEPIVMLSVTCPSTGHHYMLRVPPHMQTCHQAAAWIAGFDDPELYQPLLET